MFGKFAILVCCAGIAMCKESERRQSAPRQVSSASASSPQPIGIPDLQYPIPLEARILQSQHPGNLYSPDIYAAQNNLVQYAENSGAYEYFPSPSSPFAIRPNAVQITSAAVAEPIPNQVLVPQPIQYNQQFVAQPGIQYLPRPETEAVPKVNQPAKNPADTQKSVTEQPPTRPDGHHEGPVQSDPNRPAVQYVNAPAPYPVSPFSPLINAPQVYYDPANPLANNPFAVPVAYNTAGPIRPQYVPVPNFAQSAHGIYQGPVAIPQPIAAPGIYQAPVSIPQPIAVPAYPQTQIPIRYKVPTPVLYTGPSGLPSGDLRAPRPDPYSGYSRAYKFSPSPAVSSVNFSGLGVNYGF